MASWRNYYKRRYKRYYKKKYGSSYGKRSYGQMKAAKQQADQASFVMNIPTQINVKNVQATLGSQSVEVGTFPLNIYDLLRKSEFYQSYANMYDEFKIDNIKVKLIPTKYNVTVGDTNNAGYQSFTVYTAWDRTGLNQKQLFLNCSGVYNDEPINPTVAPNGPKNRDYIGKSSDNDGLYCIVGSDITTYSSAESRQVSVGQNSSIVRWLKPKTLSEKSQWISTSQLKPWYNQYSASDAAFKYIPTFDNNSFTDIISEMTILRDRSIATTLSNVSPAISNNPCFLEEDPTINFKPTLLVGIYPSDDEMVDNPRTVYFNVEAEVSCTFRGLRKSKVVDNGSTPNPTPTPTPTPSTVKNMPLNVTIDTYPIEFTFDERDLVDSSTQERYTGFCPVNIEVENPTFPLLYKDANDQLFEQPIEHNGKYKMVPYESEPGSFPVSGYVPKYIADQTTSDYDLFLNIPNEGQPVQPLPPNTCYFDIDSEVVEYVNSSLRPEDEQGTLRLPSDDTGLMQKVNFDIGDKDYATEVAIDLSGIQIVEDNIAVLDITPAVLQYVNDENYQRQGQINLPDGILNALTDFEDNGKGFATSLVINVASLSNLVPRPELNNNTILLQQNGTYQIGNFDNDDADVEIEPSANHHINPNTKKLSIRKIENTKDGDGPIIDDDPIEPEDPEPEPEPSTNYTIGTFTVNVPQPLITQISDYQINNVGSFNIPIPSGYDAVDSINGTVDLSNKLVENYTYAPTSLPSTFTIQTYNQIYYNNYIGFKSITVSDTNLRPTINITTFTITGDTGPTYMDSVNANGSYNVSTNSYTYAFVWMDNQYYYISFIVSSSSSDVYTVTNDSGKKMTVYRFTGTTGNRYVNIKSDDSIVSTQRIQRVSLGSSYNLTFIEKTYTLNKLYYNLDSLLNR